MLHFIYWNYRLSWKTVLDGKEAALSIENKATAIKTKLLVSKELAHFSEQIHDGKPLVDRLNILM
jgi:hypothetical protein